MKLIKNLALDGSKVLPVAAVTLAIAAIAFPVIYPSKPNPSLRQTTGNVKEIQVLSSASEQGAFNPMSTGAQGLKSGGELSTPGNKDQNLAQSTNMSGPDSSMQSAHEILSSEQSNSGGKQQISLGETEHSSESTSVDGHSTQSGNKNATTTESPQTTGDLSNGHVMSLDTGQPPKQLDKTVDTPIETGTGVEKQTGQERNSVSPGKEVQPEDGKSGISCYELGPISTDLQRIGVEGDLRSYGIIAMVKFKKVDKNLGYWVYLPPQRSLVLARLKVEEVKLKGLKDVNVLIKQKPKFAISLGIFSDKRNANRRLLKAQSLGLDAKLEHRSTVEKQMWLIFDVEKGNDLSETQWTGIIEKNKPIQLISTKCH